MVVVIRCDDFSASMNAHSI